MSNARRAVTGAAAISMAGLLLSRLSGLLRETVLAASLGQARNTDCVLAALQLPDLLWFVIAGGALSGSFMPVYTEYRRERGEDEAWRLFSVVATVWLSFIALLVVLAEIFAAPLMRTLGHLKTPDEVALATHLTRIVLPAQLAFFSGGLLMGVQWARQSFKIPTLGPTIYNLGIMFGGAFGGVLYGPERGVVGVMWGALIGAFLGNCLLQIAGVLQFKPKFRVSFDLHHPGARRVFLLMLPIIFSLSLPNVDVQINRYFAMPLFPGAATALERASRLMLVPVGIFGQAVSIGFFATFNELATARNYDELRRTLLFGLRLLAFLAVPSGLLLIVLREPVVQLLYQHGHFTAEATAQVTGPLACYSLGIWCWCAQQLVARAFHALQDTRTPAWLGTGVTVVFILLNMALVGLFRRTWGVEAAHLGLACSTSLSVALYLAILLAILRRRLGGLRLVELAENAAATLAAALAAAAVAGGVLVLLTLAHQHHPLVVLALATPPAALVYLSLARWLRLEEAEAAVALVRRRLSSQKRDNRPGSPES